MSPVETRIALAEYIEAHAIDFPNDLEDESLSSYVKRHPDVFVRYCAYKNTDGADCLSVYYRFDKESQSVTRYDVCAIDPSEKWTFCSCTSNIQN